MKIAINIKPLETGHKDRGIGYYVDNLLKSLQSCDSLEVTEFREQNELNKGVEVVHYPWFDLFFHTLPLRKIAPTIVTIHDLIPLLFPKECPVGFKGKVNFFLQKKSLSNCRFVVTDSECSKKDIKRLLRINGDDIRVVPLAANKEFMVVSDAEKIRVRRKYHLPDKFILYVGDVNYSKNLPFLIKGFRRLLRADEFQDLKLVLVGGAFLKKVEDIDHPELKSLKQVNMIISEENLGDNVLRLGGVELVDLVGIYNLATVYVQPSFYEGFGLPVAEAMSCGAPVVSSNAGSLPEVGGRAAVYFDPQNLEQFTAAISEVLTNKSLRYRLSKLGLEESRKFSWSKVAAQMLSIYQQATNK